MGGSGGARVRPPRTPPIRLFVVPGQYIGLSVHLLDFLWKPSHGPVDPPDPRKPWIMGAIVARHLLVNLQKRVWRLERVNFQHMEKRFLLKF